MVQLIENMVDTLVGTRVKPLTLTNSVGTILDPVGYAYNTGVYEIELGSSGTANFYWNTDGRYGAKIGEICIESTAAVDVTVHIEFEVGVAGNWKDGGLAFSGTTDPYMLFSGSAGAGEVSSTDFNSIPINKLVAGTPMRARCVASGATTLRCQFLEV